MIEQPNRLSLTRQCELLGLSRAALYYRPVEVSVQELELMALIDRQYLRTPFYGSRRMTAWLHSQGHVVNRKRVQRLMRLMGIEAIYQRQRTSRPAADHRIYPYLLRGLVIERVNQVWAADICYIPMAHGFLYLVAVRDWVSRYVLAWRLSNLLDSIFCIEALRTLLAKAGRRSSTPIRVASSPAMISPRCCASTESPSAWTGADTSATTSSSNALAQPQI